MKLTRTLRSVALAGLLFSLSTGQALACAFHAYLPDATLSAQIANAAEVIAARPSAKDPFRFETVAFLKGTPSESTPPHLVDSATRLRLARNPGDAVLFARESYGPWKRLLVLDQATRPLVDHMLDETWPSPARADDRQAVFSSLLAHPDQRLHLIALRELDGLPYAALRRGTYPISTRNILDDLLSLSEMPYAPIRILLLGVKGDDAAKRVIFERLAQSALVGTDIHLGAWMTAALESSGIEGLAELERLFLKPGSTATEAQLVQLVRALFVQKTEGDSALEAPIDDMMHRIAVLYPDVAPMIAQSFGATSEYAFDPLFAN
ncbi:MAG: hypothetical protein AAF484_05975 [Pseudomonadota bacterium]